MRRTRLDMRRTRGEARRYLHFADVSNGYLGTASLTARHIQPAARRSGRYKVVLQGRCYKVLQGGCYKVSVTRCYSARRCELCAQPTWVFMKEHSRGGVQLKETRNL